MSKLSFWKEKKVAASQHSKTVNSIISCASQGLEYFQFIEFVRTIQLSSTFTKEVEESEEIKEKSVKILPQ